jgi:hypothetical protein
MIATTEFDSSSVAAAQVDVAASSRHVLYACSGMAAPTGCTNTHPHYRQQQQQQGRYQQQAAAVSSRSRSRQHSSRSSTRDHHDQHQGDQATASMWSARPHYRNGGGRRTNGSSGSSGGSPRDHDALSDTVSHHSVSSAGVNWAGQRQHSQTGSSSLRSGSAASVEGPGNHVSILSKEPSENTLTTNDSGGGNTSQTPSCRALAGSLASFDTSSIINTEGVPLLEENELETEGSNSSEHGDTGSATYSEASNKT